MASDKSLLGLRAENAELRAQLDLAHVDLQEKDSFLQNLATTIDNAVQVKLAMEQSLRDQERKIQLLQAEIEQLKVSQKHWVSDREMLQACQVKLGELNRDIALSRSECSDLRASLAASQSAHSDLLLKFSEQQQLFDLNRTALHEAETEKADLSTRQAVLQTELQGLSHTLVEERREAANRIESLSTHVSRLQESLVQREAELLNANKGLMQMQLQLAAASEERAVLASGAAEWAEERRALVAQNLSLENEIMSLQSLRMQDMQLDQEARARIEDTSQSAVRSLRQAFAKETEEQEKLHQEEIFALQTQHEMQLKQLQLSVHQRLASVEPEPPVEEPHDSSDSSLRLPAPEDQQAHAQVVKSLPPNPAPHTSPRKLKMRGLFLRAEDSPLASRRLDFGAPERGPVRMARIGLACILNPADHTAVLLHHGVVSSKAPRRRPLDSVN